MNSVPLDSLETELPAPPRTSDFRRLACRALCFVGCAVAIPLYCLFWTAGLAPYGLPPAIPLWSPWTMAHGAEMRGWVWINTNSSIYRHVGARWHGNTQRGKYLPEFMARLEGDRETRNGQ